MALGLCAGCKAELLGVELPQGGRESISQEDLQRDTWLIVQVPQRDQNPDGTAEVLSMRFQQMHTRPAFSRSYVSAVNAVRLVCAEKDGQDGAPVVVLAEDDGTKIADGAAAVAALISVLKGFDTPRQPPRPVLVCALLGEGALQAFLERPPRPLDGADIRFIGPVGQGSIEVSELSVGEWSAQRHAFSQPPSSDAMEALDYRQLQVLVQGVVDVVNQGG